MTTPNADSARNVTKYTGQNYQFAPSYVRNRDPTTSDIRDPKNQGYYPYTALWINKTNSNLWALVKIANNLATWILLSGGGIPPIETIVLDAGSVTGTTITFTGNVVANAIHAKALFTNATGAASFNADLQLSAAIAATNVANVGLAAFRNTQFTVDANGFVSLAGGTTPAVLSESDDVGTLVFPSGTGNIQLVGHVNEVVGKFSTIVAGTNLFNINPMSTSRWIVDPLGFNGTHTTITSAMAAAFSGDSIFIMPGIYAESFTLTPGVNMSGPDVLISDTTVSSVTILGKITASAGGENSISNIRLQTNGDFCLVVSAGIVQLKFCQINATNNNAISYTELGASAELILNNCFFEYGSTTVNIFTASSGGRLSIYNCRFLLGNTSSTANTISSGTLTVRNTNFGNPLSVTGTASFQLFNCLIDVSPRNVTALTANSSAGQQECFGSIFRSGSATAVTATQALLMSDCVIDSSNTSAISGAGNLSFNALSFVGTSSTISTTTQSPLLFMPGTVKVTTPGAYPYTTLAQDYVILVDTSVARTINLKATPAKGQTYRIKDNIGSAGANNITISPAAGNIDGAGSYTISTNYGSVDLTYNGTQWNAL